MPRRCCAMTTLLAVLAMPAGCSKDSSSSPGASGGGSPGSGGDAGSAGISMTGGQPGEAGAGGSASGGGPGSGGASPFPPGVTRPRIMIVGDSISAGPGCYKKYLLQELTANGYSFEFVGEYQDDCGGGVRHSAVSCSTARHYTNATFTMSNCFQGTSFAGMSTLVATHNPDLIMLQLGVNDVWNGTAKDAILADYTTLVAQARAHNPNVVLVVAQIHKFRPDCSNEAVTNAAAALVEAVPAWAQAASSPQSPVFTADLWTNSDWSMAETTDCVHPNDAGAQKMGLNWYNALEDILPKG